MCPRYDRHEGVGQLCTGDGGYDKSARNSCESREDGPPMIMMLPMIMMFWNSDIAAEKNQKGMIRKRFFATSSGLTDACPTR